MTTLLSRRATASFVAVAAIASAGVAVTATAASADPGDPVTGGITTISQPAAAVYSAGIAGFFNIPVKPATGSYNDTANTLEYSLPVSGGDASVAAAYGSLKHDGAIYVVNAKAGKTAKLTKITVSIENLTLSATPAGATAPVDLATLSGESHLSRDAATGKQTYDAASLPLTAAGASYLDKALATNRFKAGQSIGSFHTEFTNTQY